MLKLVWLITSKVVCKQYLIHILIIFKANNEKNYLIQGNKNVNLIYPKADCKLINIKDALVGDKSSSELENDRF